MAGWHKVADVLRASNGDVTEKGLRALGLGYDKVRWIVVRLEAMGLIQRVGSRRQRVLALPLAEAVSAVQRLTLPARIERRDKGRAHRVPVVDVMRVLHDPGGLFAPGASFPADQVLPRTWAPDEPDQWYIGTLLERRKPGLRALYMYDGERVVKVDGRR